jgi:predicted nucleotide-binding protein
MDKSETLTKLRSALEEVQGLFKLHYSAIDRDRWIFRVADILAAGFGPDSDELKRFKECVPSGSYSGSSSDVQKWSNRRLKKRVAALLSIIDKHEFLGDNAVTVVTESPKAFVAHGGQSSRLRKLCDFLKALGVEPVIAEWRESEGRWIEGNVDKLMSGSDCYIILAEYGGIIDVKTGAKHPRLNVIDELGRSREKSPSRTILLLEKGVDLPSNDKGIIYEHFTKQNMEKAFIKVAKELVAFGIIKAVKPSE